jgi:hypothetical protein
MPYFSNKPYPAPGHQLPMPGTNKIISKEQEARRAGLKRKNTDGGTYVCVCLCVCAGVWISFSRLAKLASSSEFLLAKSENNWPNM